MATIYLDMSTEDGELLRCDGYWAAEERDAAIVERAQKMWDELDDWDRQEAIDDDHSRPKNEDTASEFLAYREPDVDRYTETLIVPGDRFDTVSIGPPVAQGDPVRGGR